MDNKEEVGFFGDDLTFGSGIGQKNLASDVNKTIDFMNSERYEDEKTDVKEKNNIDDFLNFNEESYIQQDNLLKSNPILMPTTTTTTASDEKESPKPEMDFGISAKVQDDDDYLNPYAINNNNDKFSSSEDLMNADFKDPISTDEVLMATDEEVIQEKPKNTNKMTSLIDEPKPKQQQPVHVATTENQHKTQIEAEKIFESIGLDAWFKKDRLHPKVESLIYWRDVKKSGVVFGIGMAILLAMSMFSLISVFAYLSLLTLLGTVSFRIYKTVMSAVQKTSEGHPFKEILDVDLTLSQDRAQQIAGVIVTHINAYIAELRRLFLVEDLVDSLKFGLLLYLMTYIGAIFNGMTVVILAYVAMFTLPKVYETNKQNIDQYLDLVKSKIAEITDKVKAAIPLGKKEESAKDK